MSDTVRRVWVVTLEPDHSNSTVVGVAASLEGAMRLGDESAGRRLAWQRSGDSATALLYPDQRGALEGYDVDPYEVAE